MKQPRKMKLGKVKPWTDAELDEFSTITQEDIEEAVAFWRAHAGKLANLLDAKLRGDDADTGTANA